MLYKGNEKNALKKDITAADDANSSAAGKFETMNKVLDLNAPALSSSVKSDLIFNADHTKAELKLTVDDSVSGLDSVRAILYDGVSPGRRADSIKRYAAYPGKDDAYPSSHIREDSAYTSSDNKGIYSEFTWEMTYPGSYLRAVVEFTDYADNKRCCGYSYDAANPASSTFDDLGSLEISSGDDAIIDAIKDKEPFAIYGLPELSVVYEQKNDAISRKRRDGNQDVIDFIFTDRTGIKVKVKDMPVAELDLIVKKDGSAQELLHIESDGYNTSDHCFKYRDSTGNAEEKKDSVIGKTIYNFSADTFGKDEKGDGNYEVEVFVPNLVGNQISLYWGGEDDIRANLGTQNVPKWVSLLNSSGRSVQMKGVYGLRYSESFIKDRTVPVAEYSVYDATDDYKPSNIAGYESTTTVYYGLEDGVGNPTKSRIEIVVKEMNWYDYDVPEIVVKRDGSPLAPGDIAVNNNTSAGSYVFIKTWQRVVNMQSITPEWKAVVEINPNAASKDVDGRYTIDIVNSNGEYYNFIVGDGLVNINDADELACNVDNILEVVIDTKRPKAVYSLDRDSFNEYPGDDYAYCRTDFTETITVTDENLASEFIESISCQKDRTDSAAPSSGKRKWTPVQAGGGKEYRYEWERSVESVYWITMRGTDKAGNRFVFEGGKKSLAQDNANAGYADAQAPANQIFESKPKVLDRTPPAVTYRITPTSDKCHYEGYDFYNKTFEVTFELKEVNYREDLILFEGAVKRNIKDSFYEYELRDRYTVIGPDDCLYMVTVRDTANEGYRDFTLSGIDKAGNPISVTRGNGTTDNDPQTASGLYRTGIKVLDVTAPTYVVTYMTKPKSNENISYSTAYFNTDVRVNFRVSDANLDREKFASGIAGGEAEDYASTSPAWNPIDIVKGSEVHFNSSYDYPFAVASTDNGVYRFEIAGEDAAGNKLVQSDAEINRTSRLCDQTIAHGGGNGEFWTYNKIIDTITPAGQIDIGGYYSALLTSSGELAVEHSAPYRSETNASGTIRVTQDHSPVKIEYSLVSSVEELSQYGHVSGYSYMNAQGLTTREQQIFRADIRLTDRAGNTTGTIGTNSIYLDVEAPEYDKLAPTINISARTNSSEHGPSNIPLFNGDVPFGIVITDPNQPSDGSYVNGRSSGLDRAYYTISVDGEVVTTGILIATAQLRSL